MELRDKDSTIGDSSKHYKSQYIYCIDYIRLDILDIELDNYLYANPSTPLEGQIRFENSPSSTFGLRLM